MCTLVEVDQKVTFTKRPFFDYKILREPTD